MKIAENLFDLNGKNAVVVGGAGGIGQAIAQGLAMYGANVVIASRKVESLQRAQKEIKESCGCEVIYYTVDAGAEESVKELYEKTVQQLKHIDILVNAQGFNKKYPITEMDAKVWDQMFQVNVKSVMLTMKYYGRHMKEDVGKGKIINLSSVRGIRACGGGNSGYGATKGAVDMLTRMAAKDLGPYVYVNAIGPTITYTPMMEGILPSDPKERAAKVANMPLQRIGEPQDCVGPAIFLASAASDFVSGQIIYPDGGLTAMG